MASINLSGVLLDPTGEFAVGDKVRFTHKSTTGETVQSAVSVLTIDPTGAYNIDLEYGLVLVEYNDVRTRQYKNLGVATVNQDNPATSIPELLNALVPVSSPELIEFQAILADCVAAQVAAEAAQAAAEAAAASIDPETLSYTFDTVALMNASLTVFTLNKRLKTRGYYSVGDGGAADYLVSAAGSFDGFIDHQLNDGKIARQENDGNLLSRQCGVIVDGIANPTAAIQAMIDERTSSMTLQGGDYSQLGALTLHDETINIKADLDALQLDVTKFSKRFTREAVPQRHGLTEVANTITTETTDIVYLEQQTADRFWVYSGSNTAEKRFRLRFDKDNAQFDGPVYDRPYLQRQIYRGNVTPRIDKSIAEGSEVGAWITSTIYRYSVTTNDYIEWEFEGTEARIAYGQNVNAGIADITVDGQPANLVSQIDMYGAGTGVAVEVANNLTYGKHTVRITVTGTKNAASGDFRCYVNANAGLRFSTQLPDEIYNGNVSDFPQFLTSNENTYREPVSAVTYAIAFRLTSNGAATTPFIGSVHGYENADSRQVFIDGIEQTDFDAGPFDKLRSGRVITLKQKTQLFHPDDAGAFANITLVETISANGYSQSYSITWLQDITHTNGYTQMWTASGGLAGGVPGDLNGWCDNVSFTSGENYFLDGEQNDVGHSLPNQVLFYGSEFDVSFPLRDSYAGDVAMLVTFPDLNQSMQHFNQSNTARRDGVWVNDISNHKKMYAQSLKGEETLTGEVTKGKMQVKLVYAPGGLSYESFK